MCEENKNLIKRHRFILNDKECGIEQVPIMINTKFYRDEIDEHHVYFFQELEIGDSTFPVTMFLQSYLRPEILRKLADEIEKEIEEINGNIS